MSNTSIRPRKMIFVTIGQSWWAGELASETDFLGIFRSQYALIGAYKGKSRIFINFAW